MNTIQVQMAVTLGDDAAKALAELLAPAIRQAMTMSTTGIDVQREARLRSSQNALFAGQKPPEDRGLLIDTLEASKLLKVSAQTLWGMYNSGEMPAPIRIRRAVRWSYEELRQWVEAGCPKVK